MTETKTEKAMTLARGAAHETRVIDAEEAIKLRDAIGAALQAYWDHLERHGVITDGSELLVAKCNGYITWEIELMNGALDVLYHDHDDGGGIGPIEKWGRCEEWPRTDRSPTRVLADSGQVHELLGTGEWTIYRIFPLAEFKTMVEEWPPGYGHGLTVTITMCCDHKKTGGAELLEFMEEQAEKKHFLLIIDDDGATTAQRIRTFGQKYGAPGGTTGKLD